ncbi:MAG: glycoside hydrolase family 127 protein [Roseburia sp.]|nr:glycoside hydrolase family 127 protein [Roseburia sp.]
MQSNIKLREEFEYRILKNYTRLQEKDYRPEYIFRQTASGYSWPGDWEGRTILALVLLKNITGAEPAYLEGMLQGIHGQLAQNGYLGEQSLAQGKINEQQLSGHNWLLRGLMEAACCDMRPFLEEMIKKIVENLYLPITGAYYRYPLGDCRSRNGEAIGKLQDGSVNDWLLSTDIGCAYISMDALSQYYQIYHDERILPLLQEMAETFMKIDFVGASLQTHASLSATRGIMRLYQETGEKEYLDFACRFFALYCQEGMTENYANFNWFRRPTWTETCAIVDSYMLAMELFKQTKDAAYLAYANKILYNALGHAQRSNGGFGCDVCAVADGENELLYVQEAHYEASWCCTMRGAEGLSYAVRNAFLPGENSGIFTNYLSGEYELDQFKFTVDTKFPYEGHIKIQLERCTENCRLQCYIPEHTDVQKIKVLINGEPCAVQMENNMLTMTIPGPCILTLELPLHLYLADALHASTKKTCWYGCLQLGCDADDIFSLDDLSKWEYNENRSFSFQDHVLYPLNQSIYLTREEVLKRRIKILF